jgi:hypothetical protein
MAGPLAGPLAALEPLPATGCAAARTAQSWKTGQAEKLGERQYASWCAIERGAGVGSAKQRCL